MKKIALFLFAAVAMIAIGSGTARADRGFWFASAAAGWTTYFNITNTGATADTATVTFYLTDAAAPGGASTLGSTTMTIQPGGVWNFNTTGVNTTTLSTTALEGKRGTVKISSASTKITGHTTQANATFSGFDLSVSAPLTAE